MPDKDSSLSSRGPAPAPPAPVYLFVGGPFGWFGTGTTGPLLRPPLTVDGYPWLRRPIRWESSG